MDLQISATRGSDFAHWQCSCPVGESKGQRLKTVQLSTSRTNQYLLFEAVGVPSFVLAIHNGGHVPIYEGAVDCSTFDQYVWSPCQDFKRLGMPGLDPTKPYLEKWLSFVAGCCLSAWGAWVAQMWSEVTHIGLSHLSLAFSSRFSQPDWSTVRAALASSVLLDSHCDCPSICLDKAHSPKQARTRGEGHRDRFTGHICKHSWNHCAVECKAHSKWRLSKLYRKVGPRRLYL